MNLIFTLFISKFTHFRLLIRTIVHQNPNLRTIVHTPIRLTIETPTRMAMSMGHSLAELG